MSQVKIAQIFDVNNNYVPTKASLYLKRIGENSANFWLIGDDPLSIDSTNFISIDSGLNKLHLSDSFSNFTGNGYMQVDLFGDNETDQYSILEYPVATKSPQGFYLYLRAKPESNSFKASVLVDGIKTNSIDKQGLSSEWQWFETEFVLPDDKEHILGIRMEDDNSLLDNIYISKSQSSLSGAGPGLDIAPYLTFHLQVYDVNNDLSPSLPLLIYDNKNSVNDITIDDWYNFDLNPIDGSVSVDYSGSLALVASVSGDSPGNFIIWEMLDNDEYQATPSAIKVC